MSRKKKAPRPDRGHEAKKKNRSTFPALVALPGKWCNAYMAGHVPMTVKTAALDVLGKPCILCGHASRFIAAMESPAVLVGPPPGPATVVVGLCKSCAPKELREGRVGALRRSSEDAEAIYQAVLFALAPPASGADQ